VSDFVLAGWKMLRRKSVCLPLMLSTKFLDSFKFYESLSGLRILRVVPREHLVDWEWCKSRCVARIDSTGSTKPKYATVTRPVPVTFQFITVTVKFTA
jgi:hypothetical protein